MKKGDGLPVEESKKKGVLKIGGEKHCADEGREGAGDN